MAAPISKLDLIMMGSGAITSRLENLDRSVASLQRGSVSGSLSSTPEASRANLLRNPSFEYYNTSDANAVLNWTRAGTTSNAGANNPREGSVVFRLDAGGSIAQGVSVAAGAVVGSIYVRGVTGATVDLALSGAGGYGSLMREDVNGNSVAANDVPADGQWYRFWRSGTMGSNGTVTFVFACSYGAVHVDCAKLENVPGSVEFLPPTSYGTGDPSAALYLRQLHASHITTGTLLVGGTGEEPPLIDVRDTLNNQLVLIGTAGGYSGIDIKGAAGLRVSGTGSVEVSGGGSVVVSGTGAILAGTPGAARTELTGTGLAGYSAGGVKQVELLSASGQLQILGPGSVFITGSGSLYAGSMSGARTEMSADGIYGYDNGGAVMVEIASSTGKLRVLGGEGISVESGASIVVKGGGIITVGTPGAARCEVKDYGIAGFNAANEVIFGLNELGAVGSLDIQNGDVLIGNGGNYYAFWDNSEGKLKIKGEISASTIIGSTFSTEDDNITIDSYNGLSLKTDQWYNSERAITFLQGTSIYGAIYGLSGGSYSGRVRVEAVGEVELTTTHGSWTNTGLYLAAGGHPYWWTGNARAYLEYNGFLSICDDNTHRHTRIGVHPSYGAGYGSIWAMTAGLVNEDYVLLFSSDNTFLNSRDGTIYFRDNNSDRAYINNWGLTVAGNIATNTGYIQGVRGAMLWDFNDGWLRVGQNYGYGNPYVNGVHMPGNLNIGGGFYATGSIDAYTVRARYYLDIGDVNTNYLPGNYNWSGGYSTLTLNGLDYTSISFHDAGSRVDSIVVQGGVIRLGYNAGWGNALTNVEGFFQAVANARINGKVGINSAVDNAIALLCYGLTSNSSGYSCAFRNSGGTGLMYLRNDGQTWAYQGWLYSDRKYKRDIEDVDTQLNRFRKIRFRHYTKLSVENKEYGVVAQELQEVYPELVEEVTPPGATESDLLVNYNSLASVQGKVVQELDAELQEARAQIADLEARLRKLEAKIRSN